MRRIVGILVVLALLWGAWWLAAARAKEAAIAAWFAGQRSAGWAADYDSLAVGGFPLNLDTALTGVLLADTRAQLVWTLPELRISAPAWRPTRVTVDFPAEQRLATPGGAATLGATAFRGDLALNAGPMLALRDAGLRAKVLRISAPEGAATLDAPRLRIARIAPRENRYAVTAGADALTFDAGALRILDPGGTRPATVDTLRLELEIALDAPIDRRTLEVARPGIAAIDLADLTGIWGRLELRAAGRLTVDPDGVPAGLIQIKAVNWREMLDQARAAGALPGGVADAVERGLGAMAGMAGSPGTLDVPLSFRGGRVWLGLLPLGRAPRIVLR